MIAYKLFNKRKDGSLGPLFINRKQRIDVGVTYAAESHPTNGYAYRPGWHCCAEPTAPHLSKRSRVWCKVSIDDYTQHQRPSSQGGLWYTANKLTVLEELA
jgi:hypothetical protein